MARNRIQFQKGYSLVQFMDEYGSEEKGFESPFGLELLSTVHWIARRDGVTSDEETATRVYQWGAHKRRFRPKQIALARRVLSEQGWLEPAN